MEKINRASFICLFIVGTMSALYPAKSEGKGWPDLSSPAANVGGGDHDAAVIVGIEDYPFIAHVPGARENALAWYDYLYKTRGVPAANIFLLRDGDATAEAMKDEVARSAQSAGKDGALWFVFIGHGAPDAETKDGLLVAVDAQQKAASIKSRSLKQAELVAALSKAKAKNIVVVLDACFSGRDSSGHEIVEGLQPLVLTRIMGALDPRFTLLSAAQANEFAGQLPGAGRPAFSYLALGGLRGWADANKDGKISGAELLSYTDQTLRVALRDRKQTPGLVGNESVILGKSTGERGPDLGELIKAGKDADGSIFKFEVSRLPEIPKVAAPGGQEFGAIPRVQVPGELGKVGGINFGNADLEALEKYDETVRFEKSDAGPSKKADKWRELGRQIKAYADLARTRAAVWDEYAADAAFNSMLELEKTPTSAENKARAWLETAKKSPKYARIAEDRAKEWTRYAAELKAVEEAKRQKVLLRDKDWKKLKRILALSVVSEADKQTFARTFIATYGSEHSENPFVGELSAYCDEKDQKRLAAAGKLSSMALIPEGEFLMGSDNLGSSTDERPQHKVYLQAYYIDKYGVTVADYLSCVQKGGCSRSDTSLGAACNYYLKGRDQHPQNCVTWHQARSYCFFQGKRLPSEAEWEKAARGGVSDPFFWGKDRTKMFEYGWFSGNSEDSTHPVGQKSPNQFGLYDILGNVYQWTNDYYDEQYYWRSPYKNPIGPGQGMYVVTRGGSFRGTAQRGSYTTFRHNLKPEDWDIRVGFRCALSAQQ
jgi:formylglycine-generating enzyme required for sulfatase activity